MEPMAVDVATAAKLAGVGFTTMRELVMSGTIPSSKIGRRRLVRVAAIEDHLRSAEAAGEPILPLAREGGGFASRVAAKRAS